LPLPSLSWGAGHRLTPSGSLVVVTWILCEIHNEVQHALTITLSSDGVQARPLPLFLGEGDRGVLALTCSSSGSLLSTTHGDTWSASRMSSTSWAMPWPSGKLSDINDFTIFKLPGVQAQGAVSYVLAGFGLPGVARAVCSRYLMKQLHHSGEHGCIYIYFGFSQQRTTVSTQRSFSRDCTCKCSFAGTTISCFPG
jgi:hypothetical protein